METTPKLHRGRFARTSEVMAFLFAIGALMAVLSGSIVSCGDADLLIPGSAPIIPTVPATDQTPDPNSPSN